MNQVPTYLMELLREAMRGDWVTSLKYGLGTLAFISGVVFLVAWMVSRHD